MSLMLILLSLRWWIFFLNINMSAMSLSARVLFLPLPTILKVFALKFMRTLASASTHSQTHVCTYFHMLAPYVVALVRFLVYIKAMM